MCLLFLIFVVVMFLQIEQFLKELFIDAFLFARDILCTRDTIVYKHNC